MISYHIAAAAAAAALRCKGGYVFLFRTLPQKMTFKKVRKIQKRFARKLYIFIAESLQDVLFEPVSTIYFFHVENVYLWWWGLLWGTPQNRQSEAPLTTQYSQTNYLTRLLGPKGSADIYWKIDKCIHVRYVLVLLETSQHFLIFFAKRRNKASRPIQIHPKCKMVV